MLHIENIDGNSVRFGNGYGGGTKSMVLPKTLEARSAIGGRVWISKTEGSEETVLNNKLVSEISIDGTTYSTDEDFVVAFNALMADDTPYVITTTTTTPVTTTTTTSA